MHSNFFQNNIDFSLWSKQCGFPKLYFFLVFSPLLWQRKKDVRKKNPLCAIFFHCALIPSKSHHFGQMWWQAVDLPWCKMVHSSLKSDKKYYRVSHLDEINFGKLLGLCQMLNSTFCSKTGGWGTVPWSPQIIEKDWKSGFWSYPPKIHYLDNRNSFSMS